MTSVLLASRVTPMPGFVKLTTTNPIMICIVKDGRYHGRRMRRGALTVIATVLTQRSIPRQAFHLLTLAGSAPRTRKSVYHSLVKPAVSIDAAIPQKWPMRPLLVYSGPIHIGHHNLFLVDGTFCDDFAVWSANKTLSPKFNTIPASRRLMADAVCDSDVAAIRDCVTALDRFPGGMLRCTELFLFRRMPADCCGIKNNLCAVQRRQPRRFRIPLIPANAHADLAAHCWPRLKSEIAWCEIKFLVIQRVVRDMHLAVLPEQFSISVNDRRGVVINAGAAFLEKRGDNHRPGFFGHFPQCRR